MFQGWPAFQEIAEDQGIPIFEPVQYLRVILFERAGHAISDAGHFIDQAATLFNERSQFPHGGALQLDGLKFLRMTEQNIQRYFRISRIVLGTTWREGFPVFCEC